MHLCKHNYVDDLFISNNYVSTNSDCFKTYITVLLYASPPHSPSYLKIIVHTCENIRKPILLQNILLLFSLLRSSSHIKCLQIILPNYYTCTHQIVTTLIVLERIIVYQELSVSPRCIHTMNSQCVASLVVIRKRIGYIKHVVHIGVGVESGLPIYV